MGGAKRMMEADEHKRNIAIDVAVKSRALQRCEFHDDSLLEGPEPLEAAISAGNMMIEKGKFKDVFDNQADFEEVMREVFEENAVDECGSCARWRD